MPLMYYIAALFSALGVKSITGFRAAFYFVMAALWGAIYYRFGELIGRASVIVYPVVYIILISTINWGWCILSDQFQGTGMAILFYELLLFYRRRVLDWIDYIWISLAVFISFGSAFVSIFGIFAAFIMVLLIEIRNAYRNRYTFLKFLKYIIKKYYKLVLTIAAPFAVLIGYFCFTGTVRNFYYWAFKFNTDVYSKYLLYGDSVLGALFGGIGEIASTLNILTFTTTTILQGLILFFNCIIFYT